MAEHRAVVREGVELAALAARIDRWRQLREQCPVELAAGKRPIDHLGIQTGDARTQPSADHLARERRRVRAEQREQWRQPGAREPLFSIPPDVLEEQIA